MDQTHKDALRAAGVIREQIAQRRQDAGSLQLPKRPWAEMQRLVQLIERSQERQWHGAARRLTAEFLHQVDFCHCRLLELLAALRQQAASPTVPAQAEIYREIVALQNEFDEVEVEPKTGEIRVIVGPIVLEEFHLGRFEIHLDWESSGSASPYRVVALAPYPAGSNSSVTHPHVQDERLCEGDGRLAIRAALAEGRICDFFLLVSQILATYARGSAYVELDDWEGESCEDCGGTMHRDDRYYCCHCDRTLCDDCSVSCQDCDQGYCSGCISTCAACGENYCSSCLGHCSVCRRAICTNCLENGLCGRCHEQREKQRTDAAGAAVGAGQRPAGRPDAEAWLQSVFEGECRSESAARADAAV